MLNPTRLPIPPLWQITCTQQLAKFPCHCQSYVLDLTRPAHARWTVIDFGKEKYGSEKVNVHRLHNFNGRRYLYIYLSTFCRTIR